MARVLALYAAARLEGVRRFGSRACRGEVPKDVGQDLRAYADALEGLLLPDLAAGGVDSVAGAGQAEIVALGVSHSNRPNETSRRSARI